MKKIVLLLIISILLFGCLFEPPEPPKELPEDFEVQYESGAMHLEWGHYQLTIDSKGKAVFTKTIETAISKKYEFEVSETERKKIYDAVVLNSFFSLNDNYSDPSIMDGGFTKISIKANGKRKTITLVNYGLDSFEKVENEIGRLINYKIGENAFSFNDLMDECPQRETECKKETEESNECMDWKYYCGWE